MAARKRIVKERYKIDVNRWYRVPWGDHDELVKIVHYPGSPEWCCMTYYQGIVLYTGSLIECKKWLYEKARIIY